MFVCDLIPDQLCLLFLRLFLLLNFAIRLDPLLLWWFPPFLVLVLSGDLWSFLFDLLNILLLCNTRFAFFKLISNLFVNIETLPDTVGHRWFGVLSRNITFRFIFWNRDYFWLKNRGDGDNRRLLLLQWYRHSLGFRCSHKSILLSDCLLWKEDLCYLSKFNVSWDMAADVLLLELALTN